MPPLTRAVALTGLAAAAAAAPQHRTPAAAALDAALRAARSQDEFAAAVEAAVPAPFARAAGAVARAVTTGRPWDRHAEMAAAELGLRTTNPWCANNSYWELLPAPVANLSFTGLGGTGGATWPNAGCFSSVSASVTYAAGAASVTLTGTGPTSLLCSDVFLVGSQFALTPVTISELAPSAGVAVNYTTPGEDADVALHGLGVYIMPCGVLGTVTSLLATVTLFDAPTPADMAQSNVEFLTQRGTWPAALPFGVNVTLDKANIKSGDYLAIGRLDGAWGWQAWEEERRGAVGGGGGARRGW
jgi:hypothetical protein